jgi:hypothetical protein
MTKPILLQHSAGYCYEKNSLSLFNNIIKTGLQSRNSLISKKIIPNFSVKGIFSDEHTNIYFSPTINDDNGICENTIYIKSSEQNNVFNACYRGTTSIFEYEASKISVADFLKNEDKYSALSKKITSNNLDKVIFIIKHPLTNAPLLINKNIIPIPYEYDCDSYNEEVPISLNHISSYYFYKTGHKNLYNNTLKDNDINEESPTITPADQIPQMQRKIFTNNEGTKSYRPSRDYISDEFGNIMLSKKHDTRYSCDDKVDKIYLDKFSNGNIEFTHNDGLICTNTFDTYTCNFKSKQTTIIGDNRDNKILFDPYLPCHVIGGKGADSFIFTYSYANKVIIDFNSQEGDKIHLPDYLYKTPEEALSAVYYKESVAILPIGDLGSIIFADYIAEIMLTDIIIYN